MRELESPNVYAVVEEEELEIPHFDPKHVQLLLVDQSVLTELESPNVSVEVEEEEELENRWFDPKHYQLSLNDLKCYSILFLVKKAGWMSKSAMAEEIAYTDLKHLIDLETDPNCAQTLFRVMTAERKLKKTTETSRFDLRHWTI